MSLLVISKKKLKKIISLNQLFLNVNKKGTLIVLQALQFYTDFKICTRIHTTMGKIRITDLDNLSEWIKGFDKC